LNEPPRSSKTSITATSSFIYRGVLGTSLYILCLMTLEAFFMKLSMKYASESLRTQSYIPIHLICLSWYLLQLKTLIPLHLRILLLAYILCLFRQWLPCPCCKSQLQQMSQPTNSTDHRGYIPPDLPIKHTLHTHPLLPLPTVLHIIVNILHLQCSLPRPASPL
jgi:hypothetical protein